MKNRRAILSTRQRLVYLIEISSTCRKMSTNFFSRTSKKHRDIGESNGDLQLVTI